MTCGIIKITSYIFFKFFILLAIYRGFWAVLVHVREYLPHQTPQSEQHVCKWQEDDKRSKQIIEPEKPKAKIDEPKTIIDESTILPQELHADPPELHANDHDIAPEVSISKPKAAVKKYQDYDKILKRCLKKKILFEDPEFPADLIKSVFLTETKKLEKEQEQIKHRGAAVWEWRRPQLDENPEFYSDDLPHRTSIRQGALGDCWFISAVSSLAMYPELIFRVAPIQNFKKNYAGIFHFHFWQLGEWVDVVVDDRLLYVNGELAFARSTYQEYVNPLLEKAYAKFYGGYINLEGSAGTEAFVDLTGGITHMYLPLKQKNANAMFKNLLRSYQMEALLSCGTMGDPNIREAITRQGIIKGHEYSITNVAEVLVEPIDEYGNHGPSYVESLIRIRNPWGHTEWNGRWRDGAEEWEWVSEQTKEKLQVDQEEDGEFWMTFLEFIHYFISLEIVDLTPDSLLTSRMRPWSHCSIHSEWVPGVSNGGPHQPELNPQILFTITDPDKVFNDGKCLVSISLTQKGRRNTGDQFLCMSFAMYHWPSTLTKVIPIPRRFFELHNPIYSGYYDFFRERTERFRLPPGTYLIVPSLFYSDEEEQFLLRVFSSGNLEMMENDQELKIVNPQGKHDDLADKEQLDRYEEMFKRCKENEIGWKKLKPIMDYFGSTVPHFKGFDKETVRSAIVTVDQDRDGKIDEDEYKVLFQNLIGMKTLFVARDPQGTGHISASGMQEVLLYLAEHPRMHQVKLNQKFLKMICHRFGKEDGSLSFDDFVLCLMKISASAEQYQKLDCDEESAEVNFEEWLEAELCI